MPLSPAPLRVRVILNPQAGAGAGLRRLDAISNAFRRFGVRHEIVLTKQPGHAAELARAAMEDAVDVIAIAGGDGTLNEVVQAFVDPAGAPSHGTGPDLAIIPCGTGGDFQKTFGLSGALDEAVARVRHGSRHAVDLGVLRFVNHEGQDAVRAFVNIASFGISGFVDQIVNAGPKWVGGQAAFFLGTLRAMTKYRNSDVRIRVDGATFYEGPVFSVAIANGRFFGGGMMIAPHADPSDGRFEVVALTDMSRIDVVALTAKIYRGAHLSAPGVQVTCGMQVDAEPLQTWSNVLIDTDGEQPGRLPLRATMHKGALHFRV